MDVPLSRGERVAANVIAWLVVAVVAVMFLYFFRVGLGWLFA